MVLSQINGYYIYIYIYIIRKVNLFIYLQKSVSFEREKQGKVTYILCEFCKIHFSLRTMIRHIAYTEADVALLITSSGLTRDQVMAQLRSLDGRIDDAEGDRITIRDISDDQFVAINNDDDDIPPLVPCTKV